MWSGTCSSTCTHPLIHTQRIDGHTRHKQIKHPSCVQQPFERVSQTTPSSATHTLLKHTLVAPGQAGALTIPPQATQHQSMQHKQHTPANIRPLTCTHEGQIHPKCTRTQHTYQHKQPHQHYQHQQHYNCVDPCRLTKDLQAIQPLHTTLVGTSCEHVAHMWTRGTACQGCTSLELIAQQVHDMHYPKQVLKTGARNTCAIRPNSQHTSTNYCFTSPTSTKSQGM